MSKKSFRKFLLIAVAGTIGIEFLLKAMNVSNGIFLVLTFIWALVLAVIYFGIKGKEILENTSADIVPAFDRENDPDSFIEKTQGIIAEKGMPVVEAQGKLQIAAAQIYKREYESVLESLTSVDYNMLSGANAALYWAYYIIAKFYLGEYEDTAALIESNSDLFYNILKKDDALDAAIEQVSIIKNWLAGNDELTDNLCKDAAKKWSDSMYESDFNSLEAVIYEE